MKIFLITFLASCLLLFSCASKKALTTAAGQAQDGLSYASAVVVHEKSESAGIHAEYAWLKEHYPGYKTQQQSLVHRDKHSYDIIHIVTSEGKELDVYFDISEFFGKF